MNLFLTQSIAKQREDVLASIAKATQGELSPRATGAPLSPRSASASEIASFHRCGLYHAIELLSGLVADGILVEMPSTAPSNRRYALAH